MIGQTVALLRHRSLAEISKAVSHGPMRAELEEALDRGDFRVVYQPLFNLSSGAVTVIESLVRWHHPIRGTVAPAEFIGEAEETGVNVPMVCMFCASRPNRPPYGGDDLAAPSRLR